MRSPYMVTCGNVTNDSTGLDTDHFLLPQLKMDETDAL